MDDTLYGTRTAKGDWTPTRRASYGPLFDRPFRLGAVLRWFVRGYLLPWNALYAGFAVALYAFATPSAATTRSFSFGWIAYLLVRNAVIVVAWYGLFHRRLYVRKAQDTEGRAIDTGCLNHYLHHKYFEVNYADGAIPFDRWFGSFHDGSPEAHAAMKQRLAERNVTTAD